MKFLKIGQKYQIQMEYKKGNIPMEFIGEYYAGQQIDEDRYQFTFLDESGNSIKLESEDFIIRSQQIIVTLNFHTGWSDNGEILGLDGMNQAEKDQAKYEIERALDKYGYSASEIKFK